MKATKRKSAFRPTLGRSRLALALPAGETYLAYNLDNGQLTSADFILNAAGDGLAPDLGVYGWLYTTRPTILPAPGTQVSFDWNDVDEGNEALWVAVDEATYFVVANTDPVLTSSSTATVDEGETFVMTVTATDADAQDPIFTITGGIDGALFSINDETGELTFQIAPDYENPTDTDANNVYEVEVTVEDGYGGTAVQTILVTVLDVAGDPTDIALSNDEVAENALIATAVGTFSATDPDTGETFTYSLVDGAGGEDNGNFAIVGNELRTAAALDYETQSSHSIRVRVTDSANLTFDKVFTITVTDVVGDPTDIALSNDEVAENAAPGTAVGTLTASDPDSGETFTYSLVPGSGSEDNASFTIVGDELRFSKRPRKSAAALATHSGTGARRAVRVLERELANTAFRAFREKYLTTESRAVLSTRTYVAICIYRELPHAGPARCSSLRLAEVACVRRVGADATPVTCAC